MKFSRTICGNNALDTNDAFVALAVKNKWANSSDPPYQAAAVINLCVDPSTMRKIKPHKPYNRSFYMPRVFIKAQELMNLQGGGWMMPKGPGGGSSLVKDEFQDAVEW